MSNWATLPYEVLKLIVEILLKENDQKSLVEFQVVCKHWNKPAAYLAFANVKVTNLHRLGTLGYLLMRNKTIGTAIKYITIDLDKEERSIRQNSSRTTNRNEEQDSLTEGSEEGARVAGLRRMVKTILQLMPNLKSFRFSTKNKIVLYDILEEHLEKYQLQHIEVLQPPVEIRDLCAYNPVAWRLRHSLRKATFINKAMEEMTTGIGSSNIELVRNAKEFTNLDEIKVELFERVCSLPEFEMVIDAVLKTVKFMVISASFTSEPTGAVKIIFPAKAAATIKPLPHVKILHTLDGYLSDENAIKYIIHKFPNIDELKYDVIENPWEYYYDHLLTDIPNRLSPRVQTMYFEYFMKMTSFDVFGIYLIEEIRALMSRWMAVASSVENKRVNLTISEFDTIQLGCAYVYWRKNRHDNVYDIQILFSQDTDWSLETSITSIGSCLQNITLEYVPITNQLLSTIYRECPLLERLSFLEAQIIEPIDTGELTSNLRHLAFQYVHVGAEWISNITKNLESLSTMTLFGTDPYDEEEQEERTERDVNYKDLVFDISSAHATEIVYKPNVNVIEAHGLIPPWCFIVNEESLYLNPGAFTSYPYKLLEATKKVPLSEFEEYRKKIVPSKRNQSYCVHIKCKGLQVFQLAKNTVDIPLHKKDDHNKPAKDAMFLVINQ